MRAGWKLASVSKPVQSPLTTAKGRRAMATADLGYLPRKNPCAQCGQPIAAPDWTENSARRISYLWHCQACDYRFEAVAFFDASHPNREALAA
jgi:ribosomal protein L37AE/L43A